MQNTNIVATYDYYTLDQARQIIAEENRQKAIRRAERKARKRAETIYYIKQKLSGLTMATVWNYYPDSIRWGRNSFTICVTFWNIFAVDKRKGYDILEGRF